MLFHVGIELLHSVNFIDRPKALVAHKPMGLLLGQVAELEEGDLLLYKKQYFSKLQHIKFNSHWCVVVFIMKGFTW